MPTPTEEVTAKFLLSRRSAMATLLKYGSGQHASVSRAVNIAFPDALAPLPLPIRPKPRADASLPHVDVIVMCDTEAESQATADVLTPGIAPTSWYPYTKKWATFAPQISAYAPAHQSKRLGSYYLTIIGKLRVLVYKTELHMHEDAMKLPDGSMSVPIVAMLKQMIADAKPSLFLTTGTAGGVYPQMNLGDVVVSHAAQFQCLRDFKDAPFNGKKYTSASPFAPTQFAAALALMAGFAPHLTGETEPKGTPPAANCCCAVTLPPAASLAPRIYCDGCDLNGIQIPKFHPILTTDIFEFGTTTNDLWKQGMAVEMDDACLGLACSEIKNPPKWACVRNCSDPVINGSLDPKMQEGCADYYYSKFGYWTTVNSALTAWAIIAGMA